MGMGVIPHDGQGGLPTPGDATQTDDKFNGALDRVAAPANG
ncbi:MULTISPECIES: hypothetical protein [unclassified Streptomyces]